MSRRDFRTEFWKLAHQAIKDGRITKKEVDTIWDRGRKRNYWGDHLRVLRRYLQHKEEANGNHQRQGDDPG